MIEFIKYSSLNSDFLSFITTKQISIPEIAAGSYIDLTFIVPDGYILYGWKLLRSSAVAYPSQLINDTTLRVWNTSASAGSAYGNITLVFMRK